LQTKNADFSRNFVLKFTYFGSIRADNCIFSCEWEARARNSKMKNGREVENSLPLSGKFTAKIHALHITPFQLKVFWKIICRIRKPISEPHR